MYISRDPSHSSVSIINLAYLLFYENSKLNP